MSFHGVRCVRRVDRVSAEHVVQSRALHRAQRSEKETRDERPIDRGGRMERVPSDLGASGFDDFQGRRGDAVPDAAQRMGRHVRQKNEIVM